MPPITLADLEHLPGLRRAAKARLVAEQPRTVLECLALGDVGRKTTRQLLKAGLVTDPEGIQKRNATMEEIRWAMAQRQRG
jgi:hypothetical protein